MPTSPAFEFRTVQLDPNQLVASKPSNPSQKNSTKYLQIKASLAAVGLIEPIVVFPMGEQGYRILDGHLRVEILKAAGVKTVRCLLANDDEGYTYNKRINVLSTVQEHEMILKAIKNGVSEDRIAAALNVNVSRIREKRDLLNGICPDAADMLKQKPITADAFRILRRMKPYRQVEAAELMIAARTFSVTFARAVLVATKSEDLVAPDKPNRPKALLDGDAAEIEDAMTAVQRDLTAIKDHYGSDVLTCSVALKYVASLLANTRVHAYLAQNYPDLSRELTDLTASSVGSGLRNPRPPAAFGENVGPQGKMADWSETMAAAEHDGNGCHCDPAIRAEIT